MNAPVVMNQIHGNTHLIEMADLAGQATSAQLPTLIQQANWRSRICTQLCNVSWGNYNREKIIKISLLFDVAAWIGGASLGLYCYLNNCSDTATWLQSGMLWGSGIGAIFRGFLFAALPDS